MRSNNKKSLEKFSKLSDFEKLKKEDLQKIRGGEGPPGDNTELKFCNYTTNASTYTNTAPSPQYDTKNDPITDTTTD